MTIEGIVVKLNEISLSLEEVIELQKCQREWLKEKKLPFNKKNSQEFIKMALLEFMKQRKKVNQ